MKEGEGQKHGGNTTANVGYACAADLGSCAMLLNPQGRNAKLGRTNWLELTDQTSLNSAGYFAVHSSLSGLLAMALIHRCSFCKHQLPTAKGLRLHVQNSPGCRYKWEKQLLRIARAIASSQNDEAAVAAASGTMSLEGSSMQDDSSGPAAQPTIEDDPMDGTSPSLQARVEDVPEDEELAHRYVEDYPGVVAAIIKEDDTLFEKWCTTRAEAEVDEWAPFRDEEEWELFRWLIKHVGQNRIDEFLKLSIVRTTRNLAWQEDL